MRLALLLPVGLAFATSATFAAADGLDLAPVADTFVQSGTAAGWDHALADHLDADQSPADATAAFEAGPGLYSLAIVGTSPNEASFASRESTVAAERPRLHVELGAVPVPPSTTTTTPTAPPLTTTTTPPPVPAPRTDRNGFRIQPMTLHAASGLLQGQGENLTCYHKHGPAHPMEVGRIHISMPGDGGHHVILFRPHPGPVLWPPKLCPLTLNWDQWELIAQTQHPETD